MARQKKISIGAINLTIHPHTTESYVSLFKDAYRLRRKCQVYSDKYGVIRNMYPVQDTEWGNGFMGEICIFTHIDTDQPWFNEQTNEPATDEELSTYAKET